MPKHGDLRVWWIPQVPMKTFDVPVKTLREAKLVIDTLGRYDTFQYENKVKPDFCNAGGLQVFDSVENEWLDWYNDQGESFEEYCERVKQGVEFS